MVDECRPKMAGNVTALRRRENSIPSARNRGQIYN